MTIHLYSVGLCHASVCAPKDAEPEAIVAEANRLHPTGIESQWAVSDDERFQGGETNPCACNDHPTERLHWLLVC